MTYPYKEPLRPGTENLVIGRGDLVPEPMPGPFELRLKALEESVNGFQKIMSDLVAQRDYWHVNYQAQEEVMDGLLRKLAAVEDLTRDLPPLPEILLLAAKIRKALQ